MHIHLGKIAIIILFLFGFISGGIAQISLKNPQLINSKSGLPSDFVESVLKDDQGFMWFATAKGICRWDGISAKVFQHDPNDSTSISGNEVPRNAFVWDRQTHQIIMGTENGLSILDPHTSIVKNFVDKHDDDPGNFLSTIHSIYVDRQDVFWLGTDQGIIQFNPDDSTSRDHKYAGDFPPNYTVSKNRINLIFDIKEDPKNPNILWLASLGGLLKFNKTSGELSLFYFKNKNYNDELNAFNKLVIHTNGKIYLGTWNADMVVFDTMNEQFELSFGPVAHREYYFSSPVIPFSVKSENELWVSSQEGVGIFNTTDNTIHIIKSFKNSGGKKFTPDIPLVDSNNMMWLTSEYGVYRYNLSNHNFQNYFIDPVDQDHWFLTTSFYEDTLKNRLYTGYMQGQGLNYFDLGSKTFHYIPMPKRFIADNNIWGLLPIHSKELLLLSFDEMYKFDLEKETISPLEVNYRIIPKFTGLLRDSKGDIWVSSIVDGLSEFDLNSGRLRVVPKVKTYFRDKGIQPDIKAIVVDKNNRIWFRNGLSYGYYDPLTDRVNYFNEELKKIVFCFFQDNQDTIWVGTFKHGLGFISTDEPEKGLQMYPVKMDKSIFCLNRDASGNFIMLTPDGIEILAKNEQNPILYGKNEGLIKYDKWENRDPTLSAKLFSLSDGRCVIGYRRGLGFFYPDSLNKNTTDLKPYLSSVKVFDKEVRNAGGVFSRKSLDLPHNQNFLSFEYSALAITNGDDIIFSHKLTGVDQDWVSSNHRIVNYSSLQPGKYQFIVKAQRKSSPEITKETVLQITIRPSWWRTWWAYGLYIVLIILIVYSLYRYQLRRALARKETQRLKEINELKSRLYANITHEFRTPLTVIKGEAKELIDGMTNKEQKHFAEKLDMIGRNSDKLLHLVKQMLDMSKIEDGKMKLDLIQGDVVSYLQYVLESFQSMAASKKIKLVFYHETDQIVMDYDEDKIFKISSNLLSNAIKFTPNGGKVIFHVKRENVDGEGFLTIKVQDSGIGIEKEKLPYIFDRFYQVDNSQTRKGEGTGIGLALTKELVNLMKGDISVKSTWGEKTEFCVRLPISNRALIKKSIPTQLDTINDLVEINDMPGIIGHKNLPLALIVEDNPDVAKYIVSCLNGKYRVQSAADGQQGIDAAIESIPDIIISDVMMPEKDGFEVCETLKQDERTSHIPVVLLTARATDKDRIEGLSHGADAYLTKPFNKEELFVRLEQLIKIRRQLQEKYSKVEITLTEKELPKGEEVFLKKVIEAIEKQMDNPELDPAFLAESLNLSESQLYRKLKALSGKSTAVFIRGIRLSAAKKLLTSTSLHISEIAYQCGFNNPAWFSRAFREEFGVSPSGHRK